MTARKRLHPPLRVYQNDLLVGHLIKARSGAIEFRYDQRWLDREAAFPVSLSLPLREDPWRGERVTAVFEGLLPDAEDLRARVARRVGAAGYDAYSLLAAIGRDCVGALQFIADDGDAPGGGSTINGDPLDDATIERLLNNLAQTPLGLSGDDDFRISVAGAQEKTALLQMNGRWIRPHGTTPTTHILKPRIGRQPEDFLWNSVENEFYCLRLLHHLGLAVGRAEIVDFGSARALVVERFDRAWLGDRLIRLPQEDACQALAVPPARKYQSDGGPSWVDLANLLKGSNVPADHHRTLLQAQVAFWLLGATDGHAKNFSVFLHAGGDYALTPLYDVLSAQPAVDALEIDHRQFRLAMSVGRSRHYRVDEIMPRHFLQSAQEAGLPPSLSQEAMDDLVHRMDAALSAVESDLPADFPVALLDSITAGIRRRMLAF